MHILKVRHQSRWRQLHLQIVHHRVEKMVALAVMVEEMVEEGKVVVAKGVVKEVEMEIEQEPIKLMDSLFIYCT